MTVRLDGAEGPRPLTPTDLADPMSPWRELASLTPANYPAAWARLTRQQRKAGRGSLRIPRVGSGEEAGWVTVPVFLHRPLPSEADIVAMPDDPPTGRQPVFGVPDRWRRSRRRDIAAL